MTAVWPGSPYPRGATWDGEGVNFSLFSENATKVELCLFDPSGRHQVERITLNERTDLIWHCYLPEARPGLLYGYRCYGPYDPERGHRFNPNKLLIEPYARLLSGRMQWSDAHFGYEPGNPLLTSPTISATAPRVRLSAASSIRRSPGAMTARHVPPGMTRSSTKCMCAA